MTLGLINLNSKENLSELGKEELINIIIERTKVENEVVDKILNMSEKELIEYQKELKAIVELGKFIIESLG